MEDATRPRATIVVPSFNQGRFIETCLRSLVAQRGAGLEILVYDNQSNDGTQQILRAYAGSLDRVVVERDRGQSAAINRGFREARGEVLGWLNADDMLMPGAVERALAVLAGGGAVDVAYGNCALLDAQGQFTGYFHFARPFDSRELRNLNDFMAQPSTFFRRSLFERVGPLDASLNYAMDWDLWCRFDRAGARFEYVPEVWSGARVHSDAKTTRGGFRRWLEVTRVNWRHRTLPVPMVPILYAAHRVNRWFGLRRLPALRDWWRGLVGSGGSAHPVTGIGLDSVLLSIPSRMTYPVWGQVDGLSLDLNDADSPAASVTVNGKPMVRREARYVAEIDAEHIDALDVRIERIGRRLPAPFRVLHLNHVEHGQRRAEPGP